MWKTFIAVSVVALLACVVYIGQNSLDTPVATVGVESLILRGRLLSETAAAAERGSCDDAYRLAEHYAFGFNQFDEANKWYRVAAKCPLVEPKNSTCRNTCLRSRQTWNFGRTVEANY